MIFCCDFWWRNKYPKFYDGTVALMSAANSKALLQPEDLTRFVSCLKDQIEADKPKGHGARINYKPCGHDGRGFIYLESGKDETDIARIYLHKVESVITYGDFRNAVLDVKKIGG